MKLIRIDGEIWNLTRQQDLCFGEHAKIMRLAFNIPENVTELVQRKK